MRDASTFNDELIGSIVGRRYRLMARLGRGGMATVYRGVDEVLGREVAVKIMHPALSDDAAFIERFRREAQQAARLSHPGVVAVFDWDRDGDLVFMVMEMVDGSSLREVLDRRGALPFEDVLRIISQLASALDHAHGSGIVHRDVKPENVLVVSGAAPGGVKLADFGIAQALAQHGARLTTDGVIGSVAYMAPEQLDGATSDARVDVYALGILAYELLAGRPAFEGATASEVAMARLSRSVPSPGVSPQVDGAIARATALRPADRFATAGEFARALGGEAATAATVAARPGTRDELTLTLPQAPASRSPYFPTQVLQRRRRRRPRTRSVLVGTLALLVMGGLAAAGATVASLRSVPVPDLIGLSGQQATAQLRESGLDVGETKLAFHNAAPPGVVIASEPTAGSDARPGAQITVVLSRGPEMLTVPSVTGRPLEDAARTLREAGFEVGEPAQVHSFSVPPGAVVEQQPADGRAKRGTAVAVTVSKGPEMTSVPGVAGKALAEARSALEAAGLNVKDASEHSDEVARGVVIRTDPAPGARVAKRTTVTAVVSLGPRAFDMPNLVGMSLSQAKQRAAALGLVIGNEYAVPGSGKPKGQVQGQNPPAGTEVKRGTSIDLYYAA